MMHFSQSEEDGLQLIRSEDRAILSIGISTGGTAEIRMVEGRPDRTVKATTLDAEGADLVREKIAGLGLTGQITVCVEDVVQPIIPGKVPKYDYVYARLVLHYLTRQQLPIALVHIAQQLKLNGRLFIVVRSTGCQECQPKNIVHYDLYTDMTTYRTESGVTASRRFHTTESISREVRKAGFIIDDVKQFDEDLSPGFARDTGVWIKNDVIEILAHKSVE